MTGRNRSSSRSARAFNHVGAAVFKGCVGYHSKRYSKECFVTPNFAINGTMKDIYLSEKSMIRKFSTTATNLTAHSAVKGASRMLAALVLSSAAVGAVQAQQAQAPVKVGYINTERMMRDSEAAKSASSKLESEFRNRDNELQNLAKRLSTLSQQLEKDGAVLSDSERNKRQREFNDLQRDFERKRREFQEDLTVRRQEEMGALYERADRVIKQIAESEGYDLILQDAVTVSERVDITDKVIRALNGK